jgi:hypothetical protein
MDYSQEVSSLIGRGSKNSGPTHNLPFNDPGWRLPFTSPTGTSRATGFDPRAMITSSPSEAFSIKGRRKMPGEEGHIKPEQIWHMVNYIRPAQKGPQRKPKEERPQPNTGCQRKVEMSGFSQDRNVRFRGFLQGCSAGTWSFGFALRSASLGGRRPEGLADGRRGTGQWRRRR